MFRMRCLAEWPSDLLKLDSGNVTAINICYIKTEVFNTSDLINYDYFKWFD